MKYRFFETNIGDFVVEAPSKAVARQKAREKGMKYGSCEEVSSVPGQNEYERFHAWELSFQIVRNDWNDQVAYGDADTETVIPAYPLTEEETGIARQYAEFLGGDVVREFDYSLNKYRKGWAK